MWYGGLHVENCMWHVLYDMWDLSYGEFRVWHGGFAGSRRILDGDTATHCNTPQHTATHRNTPQHTTTPCNTLRHTATHCIHAGFRVTCTVCHMEISTRDTRTHTRTRTSTRTCTSWHDSSTHTCHVFCFLDGRQILRIYDMTQKITRATCLVQTCMGWLWLVGSIKLQVSFAKEPYKGDNILQKRPIILSILLTEATQYTWLRYWL